MLYLLKLQAAYMKTLPIFLILFLFNNLGNTTPVVRQKPNFSLHISFEENVRLADAKLLGIDSTQLKAELHSYVFSGFINRYNIATVALTYLSLTEMIEKSVKLTLFLQPGKTTLFFKRDPAQYMLSGISSENHAIFRGLQIRDEAITRKINVILARLHDTTAHLENPGHTKWKDSLSCLKQERNEGIYAAFVRKNPSSLVALHAISMYGHLNLENPLQVEHLVCVLADTLQHSVQVKALKQRLLMAKTLMIGNVAPDVSQPDTSGKAITLSNLRGKFILINFWASWCKPCRDKNRRFKKVYNKFSNDGFEILGVSLDSSKVRWVKAINEDQLEWLQVSDLEFGQNEAASLYQVDDIPRNFLLDLNGRIIGRDLDEEELSNLLDRHILVNGQAQQE